MTPRKPSLETGGEGSRVVFLPLCFWGMGGSHSTHLLSPNIFTNPPRLSTASIFYIPDVILELSNFLSKSAPYDKTLWNLYLFYGGASFESPNLAYCSSYAPR